MKNINFFNRIFVFLVHSKLLWNWVDMRTDFLGQSMDFCLAMSAPSSSAALTERWVLSLRDSAEVVFLREYWQWSFSLTLNKLPMESDWTGNLSYFLQDGWRFHFCYCCNVFLICFCSYHWYKMSQKMFSYPENFTFRSSFLMLVLSGRAKICFKGCRCSSKHFPKMIISSKETSARYNFTSF